MISRLRAGLTQGKAADMLDVTLKTIKNWESGFRPIPYAAFKVMRLWGGYFPTEPGWEDWCIWRGKMYSPEGRSFEPHELRYISNYFAMARLWIADREKRQRTGDPLPLDGTPKAKIVPMASGQASGLPCNSVASPCPAALVRSTGGRRSNAAGLQTRGREYEALALTGVAPQHATKAANDELYANAQ